MSKSRKPRCASGSVKGRRMSAGIGLSGIPDARSASARVSALRQRARAALTCLVDLRFCTMQSLRKLSKARYTALPSSAVHSTSLPHTSQPSAGYRQKSSTRGTSPHSSTMASRISSGLRLCSRTLCRCNCRTPHHALFGFPLVASKHISGFFLVHIPTPKWSLPCLVSLTQVKPTVL